MEAASIDATANLKAKYKPNSKYLSKPISLINSLVRLASAPLTPIDKKRQRLQAARSQPRPTPVS